MENKTFRYTYSAKEQAEIQKIRNKYAAPEENSIERLRRLDAAVSKKATAHALIVGILGALILGAGMSLAMTDLSDLFGLSRPMGILIGSVIGAVGILPIALAYPIYNRTAKKEREKIAPEILRLTDELLK